MTIKERAQRAWENGLKANASMRECIEAELLDHQREPTEDVKQKYFEEGYDQCFREVIDEIKTWNHPDSKSLIMWLKNIFKLSAAKLK